MTRQVSIRPPAPEMTWKEELELGIESMDMQHKQLVACVAELQVVSREGSYKDVVRSMADLHEVTAGHFHWEEQLMLTAGYDDYASHKEEHDLLRKQLLDVQRELSAKRIVPCQTLSLFLERWTTLHVKFADRTLAEFLKKKSIRGLR